MSRERAPKIVAVEKEFDEPFADVIQGFAAMGYSRKAVAEILEFNLPYFRELLDRYDLHRHFLPQSMMRAECRGHGKRTLDDSFTSIWIVRNCAGTCL